MGLTRKKLLERRAVGRAFLFGLALSASVLAAPIATMAGSVEPNAEQIAAYEKSTEGARVKLLIALAKQGQHELADSMLKRYPLTEKYAVNRTLYIEGLILRGRKDNEGAAARFRAALADDPKLTVVRSELAQTLADMGEGDSAKHHLKLLEAEAPDEQAAANIRAFVKHIDQNNPFKFNAYVSLAPSTNINNGSEHRTAQLYGIFEDPNWDIAKESRKKSGVGASVGVHGSYTKQFDQNWRATFGEGASAKIYTDKSFNSYGLNQSLDLTYTQENASVAVGLAGSQGLKSDLSAIPYYTFGPRLSTSLNITARDILAESINLEIRRYPHASSTNGWATFTDLGWTHFFDPSLRTTVSVGFNRFKSPLNPETLSTWKTWYTGFNIYKELPNGITANFDGQVQYSHFDVFSEEGQKFRKDTRLIGSLGLVKRDWNFYGFAPTVEYTFVKNFSNLRIFEYNSHNFDIRLTKDF
jgi:outer membrane protein